MSILRYNYPQFASFSDLWDSFPFGLRSRESQGWFPPLDIHEDSERLTVKLDAAGLKKEDFSISLQDDVLSISGERKEVEKTEGESRRQERYIGAFTRTVTLPGPVKADAVVASYQDGVLTVDLPKAEEAKPRKIEVNLNN